MVPPPGREASKAGALSPIPGATSDLVQPLEQGGEGAGDAELDQGAAAGLGQGVDPGEGRVAFTVAGGAKDCEQLCRPRRFQWTRSSFFCPPTETVGGAER